MTQDQHFCWAASTTEFATIVDAVTCKQVADFGSPQISEAESLLNFAIGLAAPNLLAFAKRVAGLTKDGEESDGAEYLMENDTAFALLHELIDDARELVANVAGRAA